MAAVSILVVIPQNRLVAGAAVFVDTDVVAQLAKLPHQAGAGLGEEEGGGHLVALQPGGGVLDIVATAGVGVALVFELQAF
nr:hypothetical protein [Tanacetum cinerariifolium]